MAMVKWQKWATGLVILNGEGLVLGDFERGDAVFTVAKSKACGEIV